jgi:type IV pilus assembly protein PilM
MASATGSIWAIDIGNHSLKAMHLRDAGGVLEVIGFDKIIHGKVLSGTGVQPTERNELIALSLNELVTKHNISKDEIIVSVASQNSFSRFVNLPPVEKKRIPEIVQFEAAQQIPFDINEVQWDWQLMNEGDGSEIKVGLFAIKTETVDAELEHFAREALEVNYVQMAPMGLYNYLFFDRPELLRSDNEATVVINIGADCTDLVVATKSEVWQRSIPMGGNAFTRSIADAFKLNFQKAEKLKLTAPMSKYARQIFQAMRPVFTDIASEIQRSLGFYTNSHSNVKLTKVIAFGGTTRLRGLLKYLQQSLQIPVERGDSFKRLALDSEVSAAKFHEDVCDFGIVYGMSVQALGYGRIESNLLPSSLAHSMAWRRKARVFNIAAIALLITSLVALGKVNLDRVQYRRFKQARTKISTTFNTANSAQRKLQTEESKSDQYEQIIEAAKKPFLNRSLIPKLQEMVINALPNKRNNPAQASLYEAFRIGDVEQVLSIPRKDRKQMFVTNMNVYYVQDVETAVFGEDDFMGKRDAGDGGGGKDGGFNEMEMMMEMMGVDNPMGQFAPIQGPSNAAEGESDRIGGPGFIVTLSGYSPYKELGELMDPPGVKENRDEWGFVTRLMHMDELVDGNSPFELYEKTNVSHFKLDIGEVAMNAEIPTGVGETKEIELGENSSTTVLIDPMTGETISTKAKVDEKGEEIHDRAGNPEYEINDYWYVVNIKFRWKDVPEELLQPQQ